MPISAQLQKALESERGTLIIDLESASSAERPDYKSMLWRRQMDDVKLMRDVMAGTEAVREESETYLPRHKAEDTDAYNRRKKMSVFYNATRRTADGLVGMIYRKDPIFDESTPDAIVEDADNIDLRGRSLPVFAQHVTLDAVIDGHAFILVDYPRVDGQFRSIADERDSGARPYWVPLKKQDVINLRWELRGGRPVLTLVVYKEKVTLPDGTFGESEVMRYRVLRPGEFEVWEQRTGSDDKTRFVMVDEGRVALDYIPLYAVYGNRTGLYESVPPLLDLAHENIGHYQVRSDHRYALSFASVPVPFFAGVDPEAIEWGPDRFVFSDDSQAKASIMESTGNALEQSRKELADIEGRMAFLGLQMLQERGVPSARDETATAKLLDKAESDSALASTARSVQDGINDALRAHADFRNLPEPGMVNINRDFHTKTMSPQMISALSNLVASGQMPLEELWMALQEGEILPEDFDAEEAMAQIAANNAMALQELFGEGDTEDMAA